MIALCLFPLPAGAGLSMRGRWAERAASYCPQRLRFRGVSRAEAAPTHAR